MSKWYIIKIKYIMWTRKSQNAAANNAKNIINPREELHHSVIFFLLNVWLDVVINMYGSICFQFISYAFKLRILSRNNYVAFAKIDLPGPPKLSGLCWHERPILINRVLRNEWAIIESHCCVDSKDQIQLVVPSQREIWLNH